MVLLLHRDQDFQLWTPLFCYSCHIFSCLVIDQNGGIRSVYQVAYLFCGKVYIQRHHHASAVHCTEISSQPGVRSGSDDCYMFSLLAQIPENTGKALAVFSELGIGFRFYFIFAYFITYGIFRSVFLLCIDQNLADSTAKHISFHPFSGQG